MRCPKCGAGLTGTRKSVDGTSWWWCQFCRIEVNAEAARCMTLDKFVGERE